jgi:hypothetical protein
VQITCVYIFPGGFRECDLTIIALMCTFVLLCFHQANNEKIEVAPDSHISISYFPARYKLITSGVTHILYTKNI